ncbi:MAG: hypothetical protein HYY32_02005 [Chloroflexi bacterium]|nr:hypothetical protein [Chloroflexota bacterium]
MVKLEVLNPSGFMPDAEFSHAPRLEDLQGKTICELSTALWEYDRIFPLIREALGRRYPTMKFIPYTEFPLGVHNIDVDNIGDLMASRGCDAVIGGPSG